MKKIIAYIDGCSKGNPGPSAGGIVFCNEKGKAFKEMAEDFGQATNNEAEYLAAISALEKFKQIFGKKLARVTEIELRSDSQLLVNQINGKYKVLDEKIQPLFLKLWNLRLDFKKVKFKLISRKKNEKADKLANDLLNKKASASP